MQLEPITLQGRAIRLVPLKAAHADDLYNHATPELLKFMMVWEPRSNLEDFRKLAATLATSPDLVPFTIIDEATGKPIGTSSYLDIRPAHRSLEIGATWIAREHQRTKVNPEIKFLMLRHAFETLGCIRVQLKTDARNDQSRNAMLKLGCKFEGILRKHLIRPDGYVRDTAFFSVLDEEWPDLKALLIERLGYAL